MNKQKKKEALKRYLKDLPSSYVVPISFKKKGHGFLIDHEIDISNEEYLELLKEISKE